MSRRLSTALDFAWEACPFESSAKTVRAMLLWFLRWSRFERELGPATLIFELTWVERRLLRLLECELFDSGSVWRLYEQQGWFSV